MTGSAATFSPAIVLAIDAVVESTIEFCAVLAEIQKQGFTDPVYLQACDDIAALIRAQKAGHKQVITGLTEQEKV